MIASTGGTFTRDQHAVWLGGEDSTVSCPVKPRVTQTSKQGVVTRRLTRIAAHGQVEPSLREVEVAGP